MAPELYIQKYKVIKIWTDLNKYEKKLFKNTPRWEKEEKLGYKILLIPM